MHRMIVTCTKYHDRYNTNMRLLLTCSIIMSFIFAFGACPDEEAVPLIEAPKVDAGPPPVTTGTISGRYCAPENSIGIADARVYIELSPASDAETQYIETQTDGEGRFLLTDVPEGTYTVFIERASFVAERENISVFAGQTTPIDESSCTQPKPPRMLVYTGINDRVETVLEELGFTDMVIRRTASGGAFFGDVYPNWMRNEWMNYERIEGFDIMFINCSVNEEPLAYLLPEEKFQVFQNLRRFVSEGGTIYFSDFGGDILELLYPNAADWIGDDKHTNGMRALDNQLMDVEIVDPTLEEFVELSTFKLTFRGANMVVPKTLGPGSTALLNTSLYVRPQIIQPENGPSCAEFCGDQHPSGCWCEENCIEEGDCCYDYEFSCGQSIERNDTCRGRCNQKFTACYCDYRACVLRPRCCQKVDPKCEGETCQRENRCCLDNKEHCEVTCPSVTQCCDDFSEQCEVVEERIDFKTAIAFIHQPPQNDPLTSGHIIFTSFHHAARGHDERVDPDMEEDFEAAQKFLHGLVFSL